MPTALVVGASRGLGRAVAAEFRIRGWEVVGTTRGGAVDVPGVRTEHLDVTDTDQITALHGRLPALDLLFVNAGTTKGEDTPLGLVPTQDFVDVMLTNVLGPMRVIEGLEDLVSPTGLIGVMSSGQGSIANNETGLRETYRASKAALNMALRSVAARLADTKRSFVAMAPGWIRTDLGGPEAPFTIEENVPKVVDVLLSRLDSTGIEYLDFRGGTVPW